MPSRLRRNLDHVREQIRDARARGPHAAARVDVVAVTKGAPLTVFPLLADAGLRDVGENRVQAGAQRRRAVGGAFTWHGIGHLQRNKVATAIEAFDVFHALDSRPLARDLEDRLGRASRRWPVYIQVNAAHDEHKGGVEPDDALAFLRETASLTHLEVRGFMTMARLDADEADVRRTFQTLRAIRDDAVKAGIGALPPAGLSMGMTDDYPWAVEEGATVVRIGRALLEGVADEAPVATRAPDTRGAATKEPS